MADILSSVTYISTGLLMGLAIYSVFNSIRLTRKKITSFNGDGISKALKELMAIAPVEDEMSGSLSLSREELLNAMKYALFEKYEVKRKRSERIIDAFRQFGTPDLVVSAKPLTKNISLFYSLECKAFSTIIKENQRTSLKTINFWGTEWLPEQKNDYFSSYVFSPAFGGDDHQLSIAHGIGLVLLRLYTAEFLKAKLIDDAVEDQAEDITGYHDLIWGLDEADDIRQLLQLFPGKSKEIQEEWHISPIKALTKSSKATP